MTLLNFLFFHSMKFLHLSGLHFFQIAISTINFHFLNLSFVNHLLTLEDILLMFLFKNLQSLSNLHLQKGWNIWHLSLSISASLFMFLSERRTFFLILENFFLLIFGSLTGFRGRAWPFFLIFHIFHHLLSPIHWFSYWFSRPLRVHKL